MKKDRRVPSVYGEDQPAQQIPRSQVIWTALVALALLAATLFNSGQVNAFRTRDPASVRSFDSDSKNPPLPDFSPGR